MIGRFDSTQERGQLRTLRGSLTLLVIVASMAFAGPDARGQIPKARPKGVAPVVKEQPAPVAPGALPDLGTDSPPPMIPGNPAPSPVAAAPVDDAQTPKRDPRVEPAVDASAEQNPLPPAVAPPGGVPAGSGRSSSPDSDPFAIQPDRLSLGKQRVQLTIDVQAKPVLNLGKESPVRLVVTNESNTDASGVSVVYQLPDGLQLVSSSPEATQVPAEKALYHWKKPMLAAGAEWVIVLRVIAKEAKACEHAATVTAKAGSRANTTVQEPKLKVEVTASPGRLLKGNQVTFTIAVRNNGTGPARNVIVQAKLSNGLRLGNDDIVEQTIAEIKPGDRVELDPLIVDTLGGGQQTCVVEARSPDVNTVVDDQRVTRTVEVTKPELAVKLAGQDFRYTGQNVEYKLTVKNDGTAPARKVKVAIALPPQGGRLAAPVPDWATYSKDSQKLFRTLDSIEPGQSVDMSFVYGTTTPGLYKATAQATAGELRATDTLTTDVSGIAALDLQVTSSPKVIDVGKTVYYDITIKNTGSKEATRLQLRGNLTKDKLKLLQHFNVEKGEFKYLPDTGDFVFPEIDRLAIGQSITLSLEVQATASGPAGCHIFLAHAEMDTEDAKVEDVTSTTITGNGRPRSPR